MRPEPLDTVLALRRRELDATRRSLAAATHAAADAASAADALDRRIEAETARASDPAGTDQLVEAFAAWLPGARRAASQARTEHERLEAEAVRCRAELAACRTALEAIETLVARRLADRDALRARQDRFALDEAGARRLRRGGG